ncbi:dTDP-4-dehydrorhamnose reductase [Nibribacter ruber]|uniref:dTDP-4-dehydrorhamnose reductase n=1 Tax=Nibribacter ruber TaxID=2698458 RepID=A0A6P1P2Y2_9BACT|nr:dTDP-4-dehydrorhamnose reductase [Nibribacter ruber]QHL88767.1 dTDP-4-dehydrorhamnose reductase [Nibribacter ruber]
MGNLELWGGIECTVNRVGEQYFDQLAQSGHAHRLSDLEVVADLGIKKLRYPVLWEHVAPEHPENQNWEWATERLNKLRDLSIDPIVGLLHHGSGPQYTNLLDPDFPEKFATYAKSVARQFPWVTHYTPINEPLTTARFSALYGLWYPHAQDDASFVKALYNQIKGTQLAMQAIREITPEAKLVQTDDLGYIHATPTLQYQADFENYRRWLSWDLLAGKVNPQHPLWDYLTGSQLSTEALLDLVNNPCPADIIGVNYYVTSERYLDEHLIQYPVHTHGSNDQHRYADVEAVRVASVTPVGLQQLLTDACDRYNVPVVVTEAHLGCSREEQMRWLHEVWDSGLFLRKQGKNVLAVTAWSLLGAYDWNTLLTQNNGHYECGVFDVRSGTPRATAAAHLLKKLAAGQDAHHIARLPGWWKRSNRALYPEPQEATECFGLPVDLEELSHTPLLITGATGTLGRAFARICEDRGLPYVLLTRQDMDIADSASVEKALTKYKPWALVNTAGYVRVDDAENDSMACYRENTQGPVCLARHCQARNIAFVTFSSDLVFNGEKAEPYTETDQPNPVNVYGRSKLLAEVQVLAAMPGALVIRTSAFFGPWDEHNFVFHALRAFAHREPFTAVEDAKITPTYVPDLVSATLDLLLDQAHGIWHVANQGTYTWAELADLAAKVAGLEAAPHLQPVPQKDVNLPAPRPACTALASEKGIHLPSVEDALRRFLWQSEVCFRPPVAALEDQDPSFEMAAQA